MGNILYMKNIGSIICISGKKREKEEIYIK